MSYTSSWQCKKILSISKQNIIEKLIGKLYSGVIVLVLFMLAPFFDIIYIQKVALSKFSATVLKALNSSIIFDLDDAIFIYQDITYLLRKSACVVTSNKYLEDFALKYNKRIYRLVTSVKVEGGFFERNGSSVTLGWLGSPDASKYLRELIPVLERLKENFAELYIEFVGIDKQIYFGEKLDIKKTKWSLGIEKEYLKRVSIGIMPLIDDEWTRGKSGYKLIQYMSMCIPCVAASIGINKEIIKDGVNGFLVNTPEEWFDRLTLLISDVSLRQKMGKEGFRLAKEMYSYNANAPKFIKILNEVKKRREV